MFDLRFLQTNVYHPLQVTNPPFGVAVGFRQRKALKLLSSDPHGSSVQVGFHMAFMIEW